MRVGPQLVKTDLEHALFWHLLGDQASNLPSSCWDKLSAATWNAMISNGDPRIAGQITLQSPKILLYFFTYQLELQAVWETMYMHSSTSAQL